MNTSRQHASSTKHRISLLWRRVVDIEEMGDAEGRQRVTLSCGHSLERRRTITSRVMQCKICVRDEQDHGDKRGQNRWCDPKVWTEAAAHAISDEIGLSSFKCQHCDGWHVSDAPDSPAGILRGDSPLTEGAGSD